MVERNLAKVEVESSRLFSRSIFEKGSLGFPFFLVVRGLLFSNSGPDQRYDRALRACAARVTLQRRYALSSRRPDGEIGRHCGLKIRRFPEKGRAGSTPARGTTTIQSCQVTTLPLKSMSTDRSYCGLMSVSTSFKRRSNRCGSTLEHVRWPTVPPVPTKKSQVSSTTRKSICCRCAGRCEAMRTSASRSTRCA